MREAPETKPVGDALDTDSTTAQAQPAKDEAHEVQSTAWLLDVMKEPPDAATWNRFTALIHIGAINECWLWRTRSKHYPSFIVNKQTRTAHRVMAQWIYGKAAIEKLVIDHLACSAPNCVNPTHLLPCTSKFNNTRKGAGTIAAINAAKTHCLNGHELTPDNLRKLARQRICKTCARAIDRERYRLGTHGTWEIQKWRRA